MNIKMILRMMEEISILILISMLILGWVMVKIKLDLESIDWLHIGMVLLDLIILKIHVIREDIES